MFQDVLLISECQRTCSLMSSLIHAQKKNRMHTPAVDTHKVAEILCQHRDT